MIEYTKTGGTQLKCPACGIPRGYSSVPKARQAQKRGRVCRDCAVIRRRNKRTRHGFSINDLHRFRNGARQRGYAWEIDEDAVQEVWDKQGGRCALTGTVLQKHPRTWSLDRIDNSCGYTPTNIQLTLKHLNMMRGAMSVDEFIDYCRKVSAHRSTE